MSARRICDAASPSPDGSPTWCDCPVPTCVLAEFRAMGEPGGKERARQAYYAELRAAAAQKDKGIDPQDLPYRLQKLGVPAEDILALGRTLESTLSLEAAKKFIAAPREAGIRFLLLLGGPGIGKTLAAAYVIRHEARRFDWNGQASGAGTEPIQLVRAGDLTRLDGYDKADTARIEGMARCRLLAVDDMGDEGGPIGRGALIDMLLRRDSMGRPTIMTTNLTAERFAELYGAPLMDRIRVRGIAPNLSKEKSRRKRAA
jgi:DNA replication protein DnaC